MMLKTNKVIAHVIVIVVLTVYFPSCQSTQKNSTAKNEDFIKEFLSQNPSCEYNADSTMLLCTAEKKDLEKKKPKTLAFAVIYATDSSLVYHEQVQYAAVEWADAGEIKVERGLGYLGEDNAREVYIVDLKTLEKRVVRNSDRYKKP